MTSNWQEVNIDWYDTSDVFCYLSLKKTLRKLEKFRKNMYKVDGKIM